jgi:2-succinyl-6-hydroxy-2,4-cyclohexadiene-1-carboxylate synthase
MDDMALDVAGVLDQLNIAHAHVVGSSLGAEVGLSLAANHPDKVLSLVCDGAISSEYGPYSTWQGSQAEFNAHVRQFLEKLENSPEKTYPSLETRMDKCREGLQPVGWWNAYVEEMERYGTHQLEQGGFVSSFRKFAQQEYFTHYFAYRFEEYYPRVKCPLLLVAGDDAFENEPERAAMFGLASLAPRAQVVRVNGWQHPYGWMLDPLACCTEILRFLESVSGA